MFKISGSEHPDLLKVYQKIGKVYDEGFLFKKRKKRERIFRFLRRLSIGIISVSCLIILYFSVHFINLRVVYTESIEGKINIEKAVAALSVNDNKSAVFYSKSAQNNFDTSLGYIHEYKNNFLVKSFEYTQRQYNDLDYLVSTANTLSRGIEESAYFKLNLDKILAENSNLIAPEMANQEKLFQFIYESAPELFGIKANIDLALETFGNINYTGILYPFRGEIQEIGKKIDFTSRLLDQQIPLSQILPSFFGYPDNSKYLVVFEDNREMTASGGKIRAYGIMENRMGQIVNFKTFSADKSTEKLEEKKATKKPLAEKIQETKNIFDTSVLSPDWTESAKIIKEVYQKESGDKSEIDGVLALNNDFLQSFIDLSGPVKIGEAEYNSQNILNVFSDNANRGVLGDVIIEGKKRIFDKRQTDIFTMLNLLTTNLIKKNIVLNFSDESFQQIAEEKGWANEVKVSDGDYLMVVDTNIGVGANDVAISKNIGYNIDQDVNGIFADLHINYANNSTDKSANGTYKNYLRIYVPSGCELIMSKGFDVGGVEILEDLENNKSIFAGTVTIEPGKIANIRIYYKLSSKVQKMAQDGQYSLYTQKQSGVKNNKFTVDLKFANSIRLYNPTGFNANLVENNQIHWETDYLTDRLFNVNF